MLTLVSTTLVGASQYAAFLTDFAPTTTLPMPVPALVLRGFWYSGTILLILGAHEMGHYLACRYYDVDASLPFFIPVPVLQTGTMGAFIQLSGLKAPPSAWMATQPSALTMMRRTASGKCATSRP
mgnify:CR=1 FL=1